MKPTTYGILLAMAMILGCDQVDAAAIHVAARNGDLIGVQRELANGENVNCTDGYEEQTALMYASCGGHLEVVNYLLQHPEIDIHKVNYNGRSAFIQAIDQGHVEVVDRLLQVGDIDVNAHNLIGRTALHHAVGLSSTVEVLNRLLQVPGVDVNARDNSNATPLMHAVIHKDTKFVERLLEHPDIDVNVKRSTSEDTALMSACEWADNNETVRLLLEASADVHATDFRGDTALMYAARSHHNNAVMWLLDKGADVHAKNNFGETALDLAPNKETAELIESYIPPKRYRITKSARS